ncbi:unnamed protein product [Prunus armeniaca]
MIEDINYIWGSKNEGSVGENDGDRVCWKKKSKFFDLKCWKYLHVRHVLDVMHIEKNVCNSIIGTLLEIPEKNKDEIAARLDLLNMGVKTTKTYSLASRALEFVKSREENDSRLLGLKSHDSHTLMQQLLLVAICSILEKPTRYMKMLKGYVQNCNRSKGCIAEQYIAEAAVEFCIEHLSDVSTVGVPSSQKMGVSKPYQVAHELSGEEHNGVSENLRWLAAGPSMAVPSYRSYLINGVKFNTTAQDDVRTIQNSGVYLLAHTMQVASANDKNPIVSNMGFYGVIQEIWDLDYQKFRIPVLRCDWIDNTSGLVVDELGFTLVDLSKIGHRNDQFVMASQVKQVFYVDDPMHRGWLVVLSMPNREYNDVIGDDVLGDTRIECEPFTRGIPNVDTFDDLVGELGNENIRDGCEDIWID